MIENIRINDFTESPSRGTAFASGKDKTVSVGAPEELRTLSFDYKVVSGDAFNVALMSDSSNFNGYYEFNANGIGATGSYDGVSTEVLEDGYIRVTFDMNALSKKTGTPITQISSIFFRGLFTKADGYIDNV